MSPGRTFRIFVSSTFSDLKVERNALTRLVFPRLRALCEARGYRFQAVDLRWGVREEAAVDQQTVRICLDEVARCQRLSPRPNFIVLLGDRYGWCPPPSLIPSDKMDVLAPKLTPDDAALIGEWYRRDDNAVPPNFVLQPRRGAFEDYESWEPVERRLRKALDSAAGKAGLGEAARREYRASATELEIVKGAVNVPDAQKHVFAFFRTISNLTEVKAALPVTTGEATQARRARPLDAAAAALELLDTCVETMAEEPGDCQRLAWDEDAWNAQQGLKALLAERLGDGNVWRYAATWASGALDLARATADVPGDATPPPPNAALPDTTSVCEAVWQRLSRVIAAEMDDLDREARDSIETEKRAHAGFGAERRRGFVGRGQPLAHIAAYLEGGPARPLVVYGPSGSGKSALMSRAADDARAAHPAAVVVERYIGAVPGTSEARPLLESICRELTRAQGGDESTIPVAYDKLVTHFAVRLTLARPEAPIFVFLDALDQLGNTVDGRRLAWLPRDLPPHSRIVVSTLEDEAYECYPILRSRGQDQDFVEVGRLTKDEGRELLDKWLSGGDDRAARTLTKARGGARGLDECGQLELLLAKFEPHGSPLYLKLAFEEARRWHSYDGDAPAAALPGDVAGMIGALFARLSEPSQHGALIVSRALAYLAAARYGLSDEEMLALLWRDPDVREDFHSRKRHEIPDQDPALPPIIWSRLYFDLEPYLAPRDVFGLRLLTFYHRQLREVAAKNYLAIHPPHARLADYFASRWSRPDLHAVHELVFHLVESESHKALIQLMSTEFPELKRRQLGSIEAVASDYAAALGSCQVERDVQSAVHLATARILLIQEVNALATRRPDLGLARISGPRLGFCLARIASLRGDLAGVRAAEQTLKGTVSDPAALSSSLSDLACGLAPGADRTRLVRGAIGTIRPAAPQPRRYQVDDALAAIGTACLSEPDQDVLLEEVANMVGADGMQGLRIACARSVAHWRAGRPLEAVDVLLRVEGKSARDVESLRGLYRDGVEVAALVFERFGSPTDALDILHNAVLEYRREGPPSAQALVSGAMLAISVGKHDWARRQVKSRFVPPFCRACILSVLDGWSTDDVWKLFRACRLGSATALDRRAAGFAVARAGLGPKARALALPLPVVVGLVDGGEMLSWSDAERAMRRSFWGRIFRHEDALVDLAAAAARTGATDLASGAVARVVSPQQHRATRLARLFGEVFTGTGFGCFPALGLWLPVAIVLAKWLGWRHPVNLVLYVATLVLAALFASMRFEGSAWRRHEKRGRARAAQAARIDPDAAEFMRRLDIVPNVGHREAVRILRPLKDRLLFSDVLGSLPAEDEARAVETVRSSGRRHPKRVFAGNQSGDLVPAVAASFAVAALRVGRRELAESMTSIVLEGRFQERIAREDRSRLAAAWLSENPDRAAMLLPGLSDDLTSILDVSMDENVVDRLLGCIRLLAIKETDEAKASTCLGQLLSNASRRGVLSKEEIRSVRRELDIPWLVSNGMSVAAVGIGAGFVILPAMFVAIPLGLTRAAWRGAMWALMRVLLWRPRKRQRT